MFGKLEKWEIEKVPNIFNFNFISTTNCVLLALLNFLFFSINIQEGIVNQNYIFPNSEFVCEKKFSLIVGSVVRFRESNTSISLFFLLSNNFCRRFDCCLQNLTFVDILPFLLRYFSMISWPELCNLFQTDWVLLHFLPTSPIFLAFGEIVIEKQGISLEFNWSSTKPLSHSDTDFSTKYEKL